MYVGSQGPSIFILPRHSEGKTHGEPQGWAFLGPAQVTSLVEVRSPRTFGRGGGDCGDREARGPGQRVAGGAPRPLRRQSGSRASGERSLGGEGRTTPAEAAPGPAARSCSGLGRLRPQEPRAEGAATGNPAATAAARPRLLRLRCLPGGGSAVPAPSSPSPPLAPPSPPPPGALASLTRRPVPPRAPRLLLLRAATPPPRAARAPGGAILPPRPFSLHPLPS
ncbi:uncharacterized protein LOC105748662 [Orcinus orca]|uniref:uncharacterized protein LOC105748662 n=1 Tax=Orcinus orca TaxID=9733 RepID=UPI00062B3975|nr:uncharacterized protein LOC105748662 [Orcinus orca]